MAQMYLVLLTRKKIALKCDVLGVVRDKFQRAPMYSVIDEGSYTAFHQQHKDEIGSINYLVISV